MALAQIYQKKQSNNPNGDNFIPPVKPIKYSKTISVKNGTISATSPSNSLPANTILSGK